MAEQIQGKITQIIGAVLDIKFPEGKLPKIYDAIHIAAPDGGVLTAEVAQQEKMSCCSSTIFSVLHRQVPRFLPCLDVCRPQ